MGGAENLVREGLLVLAEISAPVLGALMLAGLVIGVLQAATQINDPAVGFLPRLTAGVIVVAVLGGWMVEHLAQYFKLALQRIAEGA